MERLALVLQTAAGKQLAVAYFVASGDWESVDSLIYICSKRSEQDLESDFGTYTKA